jgi:hypothetical protein
LDGERRQFGDGFALVRLVHDRAAAELLAVTLG